MKQITEDYVSFETAVLLKEKGFKNIVQSLWIGEDEHHYISTDSIVPDDYNSGGTCLYSAPTHQMTIAWILEKYNVYIEVSALKHNYWVYTIYKIFDNKVEELYNEGPFKSHEEAVEAAIKYTLENLI